MVMSDLSSVSSGDPRPQSLHVVLENTSNISTTMLKEIIAADPQSISSRDEYGRLPIHTALRNDYSIDVVRFLIDAYPECLSVEDNDGYTPLATACMDVGDYSEIIPYIVELYPEGLLIKAVDGGLPIHLACCNKYFGDETIFCLSSKCPQSLIVADERGYLPIHYICLYASKVAVIPTFVDTYPDSLKVKTCEGRLPIHLACDAFISSDTILYLASRCPESLRIQDNKGYLPIHYVFWYANEANIIPVLIDMFSKCLLIATSDGRLPIHIACETYTSHFETIDMLVKRRPETLRTQDDRGFLPIHYVCGFTSKASFIPSMVEMYPECLMVESCDGRLPIHIACDAFMNYFETIEDLAAKAPESLSVQDSKGYLPLHYACLDSSRTSLVRSLVDAYSDGLMEETNESELPIHIACSNSVCPDMIELLASRCPDSLRVKSHHGLPLHILLNNPLAEHGQADNCRALRVLLQHYPKSVHVKSGKGDALDIARKYTGGKGLVYRLLLNSDPDFIVDLAHLQSFNDFNWLARRPTFLAITKVLKSKAVESSHPRLRALSKIAKLKAGCSGKSSPSNGNQVWATDGCLGSSLLSTILSFL